MSLTLSSPAFADGEKIPLRYSGDGEDISPPLNWSGLPEGAVELALICDDPDAPTPEPWVHWIIYGMEPTLGALPESLPTGAKLKKPVCALQGVNSWGRTGYGGPAPPRGHGPHHYHFVLYCLGKPLGAKPGWDKDALLAAMEGSILAHVGLTGTYQR